MKQARYKEPLPLAVIEAARAGDAGAVQRLHKQALYPDAL